MTFSTLLTVELPFFALKNLEKTRKTPYLGSLMEFFVYNGFLRWHYTVFLEIWIVCHFLKQF